MFAFALLALSAVPAPLTEALSARAPEGTRLEVLEWSAPSCRPTRYEPQAVEGSGRVAVHVVGATCAAWGWATVRVFATRAVVTRTIAAGAPLDGALSFEEREWQRGTPATPSVEGAVAARELRPGMVLRGPDVRFGPAPGTSVTVRLVLNAISVEQRGVIVPCSARVCASLPSGKRVTGTMRDGVLVASLEGGS